MILTISLIVLAIFVIQTIASCRAARLNRQIGRIRRMHRELQSVADHEYRRRIVKSHKRNL